MKNKIISIAALYIILILIVICSMLVITEDREAPKIIFGDEEIEYTEDTDTSVLLTDVSAIDEKDGNVTNTLTIESIRVLSSGKKANIIYAARDSKNNISKANRVVKYIAATSDKPEVTPTVSPKDPTPKPTQAPVEATNPDEEISNEPLVSTGDPVIRLNTHEVTIEVGGDFNYANYIDEAVDDKDNVYRRMHINGRYSTEDPGEYTLTYYATDTDGNKSNEEKLTLIVQ